MRYQKVKRCLDLVVASFSVVVLSPLFLLTALIVKLDSDGPVIFKQSRIGKGGRTFTIYKFRSMALDNDVYDFTQKDRVTKVGKVLRKYGIDELPQLFNVIKGDMSLVGPRPYLLEYGDYYTEREMKRTDVLPGIVGPNTCRCERLSIFEKNKLDDLYVDNFSFKQDFGIVRDMILNCGAIFTSRESCSLGNKDSIRKELMSLKENHDRCYQVEEYVADMDFSSSNAARDIESCEVSVNSGEDICVLGDDGKGFVLKKTRENG